MVCKLVVIRFLTVNKLSWEAPSAISDRSRGEQGTLGLLTHPTHKDSFRSGTFKPGGVLRISSDRDDRMGAKIKTQKNPWAKIYPPPPLPTKKKKPIPKF